MNEKYRPFLTKMSKQELIGCIVPLQKNNFKSKLAYEFYIQNEDKIGNLDKTKKYTIKELRKIMSPPKIKTEDTGLIFEYALCIYYGIPYDGKFKYEIPKAEEIADVLKSSKFQLKNLTGIDMVHTAAKQARYDFTSKDGKIKFHAKSAKKIDNQKQAAEVIGQGSMKTLINHFNLPITYNRIQFKSWIMENIDAYITEQYNFLFNEPICYFIEDVYECYWITPIKKLNVEKKNITFTRNLENWGNSNTIKYNGISIAEIQFHSSSRINVATRFNFNSNSSNKTGIFVAFPEYFDIKKLF